MAYNNFFIGQGGLDFLPGWGQRLILVSTGKVRKNIIGMQEEVGQLAVGQLDKSFYF
jgi:hypothetical protein